jgi:hypothetical protein
MTVPSRVHIRQLVFHGVPRAAQAEAVEAFRRELRRLLAEGDASQPGSGPPEGPGDREPRRATPIRPAAPAGSPLSVGQSMARTVHARLVAEGAGT